MTDPKSAAEMMREMAAEHLMAYAEMRLQVSESARERGRIDVARRVLEESNASRYCASVVAALPLPPDPRDAEIARLRKELAKLQKAARGVSNFAWSMVTLNELPRQNLQKKLNALRAALAPYKDSTK